MLRRLLLVMTWAGFCAAGFLQHGVQAQPIPSFASAGATRAPFSLAGMFRPKWTGPGFVGCENNGSLDPVVYIIAADGTRDNVKLSLGDSAYMTHVFGAAVRPDKAVAVIGNAQSSGSGGPGFVGFISPNRLEQTYIRLSPYSPRAVTFAADGTIWTAGWVEIDNDLASDNFIRRFDSSGKQIGSYLPMRTPGLRLGLDAAYNSFLVASSHSVGWYVSTGSRYLEFNLQGKLLRQYPGVPWGRTQRISGVALSPDDRVFVSREDRTARKWEVFLLDKQTRTWLPVELPGLSEAKEGYVAGFDGDDLVAVPLRADGYYIQRYRVTNPTASRPAPVATNQ